MSAARPDLADIDAAIARGEWWARLFDELSDRGLQRVEALPGPRGGPLGGVVQAVERIFRAVRLAVVAAMRLDQILSGLAALRKHSAADIAAARARARAKAEAEAAARERRTDEAQARREARAEVDREEADGVERDRPEPGLGEEARDRDPLVDALDTRLASVDPAIVDFDDLGLRETALRICADLGVTPDWGRWEAGDWATPETPANAAAEVPSPPRKPLRPPPRPFPPPVRPNLPQFAAGATDIALSRVLPTEPDISGWRSPRLE